MRKKISLTILSALLCFSALFAAVGVSNIALAEAAYASDSRDAGGMTLEDYNQVNPNWERQMQGKLSSAAALAVGGLAEIAGACLLILLPFALMERRHKRELKSGIADPFNTTLPIEDQFGRWWCARKILVGLGVACMVLFGFTWVIDLYSSSLSFAFSSTAFEKWESPTSLVSVLVCSLGMVAYIVSVFFQRKRERMWYGHVREKLSQASCPIPPAPRSDEISGMLSLTEKQIGCSDAVFNAVVGSVLSYAVCLLFMACVPKLSLPFPPTVPVAAFGGVLCAHFKPFAPSCETRFGLRWHLGKTLAGLALSIVLFTAMELFLVALDSILSMRSVLIIGMTGLIGGACGILFIVYVVCVFIEGRRARKRIKCAQEQAEEKQLPT